MEDYQIVELIAQGGYGIVLKALHKETGEMVAIKQFRDSDSYTLRIAEREISVLKLLQGHPNIIKMISTFQHSSKVFLVFELMQQTLLDMLQGSQEGKLGREQAIHRDIKPENMLLSRVKTHQSGNQSRRSRGHSMDVQPKLEEASTKEEDSIYILKVCDLGQAKEILDRDGNMTEYVSTRWYRAPELLVGSKNYEKSVDIWALGCIIPELISGKPLFPGKSNLEALAYIIRTFGNKLTEEQVQRFHENPEFTSYGKVPQIRNVISLEQRVPEMNAEELDFVLKCLALDPKERLSAKQLLNHSYLDPSNWDILKNYKEVVLNEQIVTEELKESNSNIAEIIEESEGNSSLKGSIKGEIIEQRRFETEQDEIQISRISNSHESEADPQMPFTPSKKLSQVAQKSNKVKKRPSSSGHQSNQHREQKEAASRQSNNNSSSNGIQQTEEAYGQETNNYCEQNVTDSTGHKQLPKPILFLRKQKEAREQTKGESKQAEQKSQNETAQFGAQDIPFELAQDVQQQVQETYNFPNRISESTEPRHSNTISKINREKVHFNQAAQMPPRREPIGLLNSSHKQKRFSDQVFQNEKQRLNYEQQEAKTQHPQQLYTIQKNKVLFANLKNNVPQGRSPPVKLNNPKLLIQNLNIQRNQAAANANQQKDPKFIDLKISQPKARPSQNQIIPRNVSQPPQPINEDPFKMTQNTQFSKMSNHDQPTSKSPSQLSFTNKYNQQEFLPLIKQEKFVNLPKSTIINSGKAQLLNTQKHVSNKIQLPSINHQQISAAALQQHQQMQVQGHQSYRKSSSIKSINHQADQPQTAFMTRLGTSQAKVIEAPAQLNPVRIPSRGMVKLDTRSSNGTQSYSPPHNQATSVKFRNQNWHGSYNQYTESQRLALASQSNEKSYPSIDPYQGYINSPPKPMSRNSLNQKTANFQGGSVTNIAGGGGSVTQTHSPNFLLKSSNKPPKR